jgi:hypothetical protein
MYENFRLAFSVIWLIATACVLASALAFIFTWGGYLDFLYISVAVWCISTLGAIVTSL